jgi:hypothetical protein
MTKTQARAIILILSAKHITFRIERKGATFTVFFNPKRLYEVERAYGVYGAYGGFSHIYFLPLN